MRNAYNTFYSAIFLLFSISMNAYAGNPDSLLYCEKIEELKKIDRIESTYSAELETARELTEKGLYKEAVELLDDLVFSSFTSGGPANKGKKLKTHVELIYMHNKIVDINEKELTTSQRDSINLLKNIVGGAGVTFEWQLNKLGITSISPIVYLSNIAVNPRLKIQASYWNNMLHIENTFWPEKVVGDFITENDSIPGDTGTIDTSEVVYTWIGMKKDSSDLISNKLKIEYTNQAETNNFIFAFPVYWNFMRFRINNPRYESRSNYTVNPYLEYRFNTIDITLSGNWYCEIMDYFGEGRIGYEDTTAFFNANLLDRIYTMPQATFSLFYKKFNAEFTESLIHEYYFKRNRIYKNLREKIYNKQQPVQLYEHVLSSTWLESSLRCSYRLFPWLYTKCKVNYLTAYNDNLYIEYKKTFIPYQDTINCKKAILSQRGTNVYLAPSFEFHLPLLLKIGLEYTLEKRTAPITDSLAMNYSYIKNSVFFGKRYLWEAYTAHEPEIKITFKHDRFHCKISESFRYEDLVADSSYQISNSTSWRTKCDFYVMVTPVISVSFIGYLEFIRNKIGTMPVINEKLPEQTSNISISSNISFRF